MRTSGWLVGMEKNPVKLTASKEGESRPRWTPDGKYLTFLSSRYETKSSQIWRMDRRGGEAEKLTELKYQHQRLCMEPGFKEDCLR
jgi:Tol biopolymer transport system component